ncbi:hypothetical protein SPSIL_051520 [Sporomusa silvacetica DSM 10669]|uniref:histidine kinase n=1 Tax=Sporomusa silvacetica DSM 10669 TaxID=1123289 RepID=A0ABZ3IU25_9FIRM|nr:histidine kinase N-terminal 7TM domain-containing protein [Sporomusa silvacetica]OZC19783.1 sensor histidine kinase LiaS [Sporomusa silvacetica DSM 10669]
MNSLLYSIDTLQVMVYHPIKEIWFYLLVATALAALAGYTWQYRRMPAARWWIIGLSLRAVLLLSLVVITVSPALEDKIFWTKMQQMSAIALIPTFLLLAANFAEQKTRIIKTAIWVLVALSGFGILALLTTGWHGLYWRGVVWDGVTFGIVRGPIYWVMSAIGYFQFLLVCVLCIIWSFRFYGLRRWQIAVLPINPLIAVIGHILWVIDQQTRGIPSMPLAFLLSSMGWSWIFFRLRVLNLAQLAQTAVTRSMNDSLIVIDDQDYIVELNSSAYMLLDGQETSLNGSRAATALAPWPALAELACSREVRTGEISLADGYYLFRVTPLAGWGNREMGKAIVLQDIGELKQAQAKIVDQQKALSIMAERARLGRELHDGAGQIWSYINMKVEAARSLLAKNEPAQADMLMERLAGVVRDVHVDIRESIAGLRTTVPAEHGLWEPLEEYLHWFRQNNDIDVELIIDKKFTPGVLPSVTEVQLLRIIQEALTNIRKHSDAGHARIIISQHGSAAEIRVEDDGRGFDPILMAEKKGKYGIKIMEERAGEVGAQLRVESALRAGTRIVLSLPLTEG